MTTNGIAAAQPLSGRTAAGLVLVGSWLVLSLVSLFAVLERLTPRPGAATAMPWFTVIVSALVMVGLFVGIVLVVVGRSAAVLLTVIAAATICALCNLRAVGAWALVDVAVLSTAFAVLRPASTRIPTPRRTGQRTPLSIR
jgi:hypothetical protein